MSNRRCSDKESCIVINQEKKIDSPVPKIDIRPFILAPAIALAVSPMPKMPTMVISNEAMLVGQENKNELVEYPTLSLRYEDGQLTDCRENLKENNIPVQINSSATNETTVDITFQQIVGDLRKENAVLKNRLRNSLPAHTLTYMIVSSMAGTLAATLLFVRFILNVYIIDPYYLICTLIIAVGLFFTAFTSLKDWKDNLLNERTN